MALHHALTHASARALSTELAVGTATASVPEIDLGRVQGRTARMNSSAPRARALIREYWSQGRPVYDPGRIVAPVLLVHAEWDADVPLEAAQAYFLALANARYRRWVEIGEGTHMVLLEDSDHRRSGRSATSCPRASRRERRSSHPIA